MTSASEQSEQRKLAAIMFTDMVGYSTLAQHDDKLALDLLEEHRQLLREIFPRFNGVEIKTIGDAFLFEFHSALEAAQCAIEIQRMLSKRNHDVPSERRIEVRIGVHIGDVVHRGGDVYGDGVNIASRIEALAGAGGICVSMDVERQIRNALEARFEKLAPTELKNISVAMDLFRIVLPWERRAAAAAKSEIGQKRRSLPITALTLAAILVIVVVGLGLWWATRPRKNSTVVVAKSIAVLPFENLSDDKQNAYFADGIQDEILTKLAGIADLKVISRTSTAKYKSKPEDLKVVSQELGVATALEGTVQKSGEKVRINVQLIDARADSHLWAKSYDRDAKDIFAVESEVSQQIADALRAKLSPSETKTLAKAPTQDPKAYDFFLKGEFERRQGESLLTAEWFERSGTYYRQALSRDPNFALAAARLAESRLSLHFYSRPFSPKELEEVKPIIDRALALDPDLAEAHEALGLFYYWGYLQYEQALVELRRAIELQPNNASARGFSGYVYRRQGKWEQSIEELAKCEALDPRDPQIPGNSALSYTSLRYWNEAKRAGSRSIALDPHIVSGLRALIIAAVNGEGDIGQAKSVMTELPAEERLVGNTRGGMAAVIDYRPYLFVLERDFDAALKSVPNLMANDFDRRATLSARAAIRALAGAPPNPENEEARDLLETRLGERRDDSLTMTQLSWVYLALGRTADALRLAQQAASSLPLEKDALAGPMFAVGLAEIQARTGETAEAIKGVRRLLAIPAGSEISLKRLQLDPVWDPIRSDPQFQQLLAGKEQIGPNK